MNLQAEAISQGLTADEYDRIVSTLGRDPNSVELGIFSAMWSEHCCYKSSKIHLKQLPTRGPLVVLGPGENAGVIDLGDDLLLAFKIESHNHPSFIEPYQGAATGVGGILRDIFTMGARPIAILDSLRFGDPKHEKTSFLVHGVIGGVGGYGNCIGIPNVGGEVYFDPSYNGNNLVNAMAVGIVKRDELQKAIAKGTGNRVLYLGSKTGKDGIHGATMASEQFGSGNEERRPTVQVGDPFTGKLLLEACLEMAREKILVGMQDMGAAGIACSTFEMSARGGSGMEVNLDKVPLREAKMSPWEIFLSESQERMLLVVTPDLVARVLEIAAKWEIDCVDVGVVTDTGRVVAKHRGETVVDLAVAPITDEAPLYDRPWKAPKVQTAIVLESEINGLDLLGVVNTLIAGPNLSSRKGVYRQYDQTVGDDTVVLPGSDAGVIRIKGRKMGVAVTVDSNSDYCASDPYQGVMHVVAEGVRNLACVGAKAVAVTNCLNFGNPEDPEVMGQIRDSIRGLSDACKFFSIPVTGGNVSLYNQTGTENIKPTPTVGIVGFISDIEKRLTAGFKKTGSKIALIGHRSDGKIYQSEFAKQILKRQDLACPPLDLSEEGVLQKLLLQYCDEQLIESAHDLSTGGLFSTLLESSLSSELSRIGAKLTVPEGIGIWSYLFGEYGARAIISFPASQSKRIEEVARNHGVHFDVLGMTCPDVLSIEGHGKWKLSELKTLSESFFKRL